MVLIDREGRGREAMSTCSAGGQSKVVANSARNAMCLVWVRDDSKHRQNDRTVLYYSRLYDTIKAGRPGSSEVHRHPLTRWDVSSIPANGIFLTKKLKNENKNAQRVEND